MRYVFDERQRVKNTNKWLCVTIKFRASWLKITGEADGLTGF
jgi:hypothetical protein